MCKLFVNIQNNCCKELFLHFEQQIVVYCLAEELAKQIDSTLHAKCGTMGVTLFEKVVGTIVPDLTSAQQKTKDVPPSLGVEPRAPA